MTSLNSTFKANPIAFLQRTPILPDHSIDHSIAESPNAEGNIHYFSLRQVSTQETRGARSAAFLEHIIPTTAEEREQAIKAYYLPWQPYATARLDLSSDADVALSSRLTACRFAASGNIMLHIAGNQGNSGWRQEQQEEYLTHDEQTRAVVLSPTHYESYNPPRLDNEVNVYGIRDRNSDTWHFYKQQFNSTSIDDLEVTALRTTGPENLTILSPSGSQTDESSAHSVSSAEPEFDPDPSNTSYWNQNSF